MWVIFIGSTILAVAAFAFNRPRVAARPEDAPDSDDETEEEDSETEEDDETEDDSVAADASEASDDPYEHVDDADEGSEPRYVDADAARKRKRRARVPQVKQ